MTPKEKAQELITKYQHPISEKSDTDCLHIEVAKEFALIAVNEILDVLNGEDFSRNAILFWSSVKQEIHKL